MNFNFEDKYYNQGDDIMDIVVTTVNFNYNGSYANGVQSVNILYSSVNGGANTISGVVVVTLDEFNSMSNYGGLLGLVRTKVIALLQDTGTTGTEGSGTTSGTTEGSGSTTSGS